MYLVSRSLLIRFYLSNSAQKVKFPCQEGIGVADNGPQQPFSAIQRTGQDRIALIDQYRPVESLFQIDHLHGILHALTSISVINVHFVHIVSERFESRLSLFVGYTSHMSHICSIYATYMRLIRKFLCQHKYIFSMEVIRSTSNTESFFVKRHAPGR